MEIRSIEDADSSAVIGINAASVWATNPMDESGLDRARKSMRPTGSCLEFWATLDVVGPRQVCVRRIASSEVRQVEREDGAIWTA